MHAVKNVCNSIVKKTTFIYFVYKFIYDRSFLQFDSDQGELTLLCLRNLTTRRITWFASAIRAQSLDFQFIRK